MKNILLTCAASAMVAVLSACQTATLIQLNDAYANLKRNETVARTEMEKGILDPAAGEAVLESVRTGFVEYGDKAIESAEEASSPGMKAQFLNIAARNYLSSRPLADKKVPDTSEQGRNTCALESGAVANGRPTTCGYFHFVDALAVNNESTAEIQTVLSKLRNEPPGTKLSAADGKELLAASVNIQSAFDTLTGAKAAIKWGDTSIDFHNYYYRQQDIFLCNVYDVVNITTTNVFDEDGDWKAADAITELERRECEMMEPLLSRADYDPINPTTGAKECPSVPDQGMSKAKFDARCPMLK